MKPSLSCVTEADLAQQSVAKVSQHEGMNDANEDRYPE